MRTFLRILSRQRLTGRWTNFELAVAAIVSAFGLALIGLVAFTVAVEARYALEGSVVEAHLLTTRVSPRADQIQLTYAFTTPDGRSLVGTGWTPANRGLAKDALPVEFARSDPTLNRPHYDGRAVDLLTETAAILATGLFLLSISLVPYLAARWRTGVDRRLQEGGVRSGGTITSVSPYRTAPSFVVVRYEYMDPEGVRRQGEAYDYAARVRLRPGDTGPVLVDPDRPSRSMWISDA
jgi:uncharacterized protein DUF3592